MSDFDVLRPLRVGCVRYLNSRPLIEPYDGPVIFDHPSKLARDLVAGELDVALVPVFEAIRTPGFRIVNGVAIAAFGPVLSVFVAHKGPAEAIRKIALDPASLSSVNLCKVLFAEWQIAPVKYVSDPAEADARLIIGDQAIAFMAEEGSAWNYLDLGEEWQRRTGLPFVFAVWLIRPGVENAGAVADAFREIARRGQADLEAIAARQPGYPEGFALRYFSENVRFELGESEKEAMELYARLLARHGLLPPEIGPEPFLLV